MSYKTDSYLWNICTGFGIDNLKKKTKKGCLDNLLQYKSIHNESIPVILFDLFPFHGIQLKTNIRTQIGKNLKQPYLLADVIQHTSIFNNIPGKYILFSVPPTIWNSINSLGYSFPLESPINPGKIINTISKQSISSKAIIEWRKDII
jgi:hypothetical protein